MAKLKLDLSKVKHVKSDKDSTTLRHADGHTIQLMHAALSPENQAQLSALSKIPQQASQAVDKNMAEGGRIKYAKGTEEGGVFHEAANAVREAGAPYASGAAQAPAKTEPTNYSHTSSDIGYKPHTNPEPSSSSPESATDEEGYTKMGYSHAEGGEIKKPEAKPKEVKENTLDYNKLREEKKQINSNEANKPQIKRKMYADPNEAVSQNDSTPTTEVPENLSPLSANQEPPPPAAEVKPPSRAQEIGEAIGHALKYTPIGALNEYNKAAIEKGKEILPDITKGVQGIGKGLGIRDTTDEDVQNQSAVNPQPQQLSQAPDQAPTNTTPQAPVQSAPSTPPQVPAPIAKPEPIAPPTFAEHKQNNIQDLTNEHQAFERDIADGHITPKTYSSLMADMKTPEKIGTIFGMLLSGAGSGLTKQPNAVFALMNQQIQNDLQAQQETKQDTQNLYHLNQQNLMNQANIRSTNIETDIKARALTKMQANSIALHTLVKKVADLPAGTPERQQAEQMLGMLNQSVQTDNYNLVDRAASASAYYKMMGMGDQGNQNQDPENAFKAKNQFLRISGNEPIANANESHHLAGYGTSDRAIPEDMRQKVNAHDTLDLKGKDILNYIQQNSGTWNPKKLSVASQKLEEMKNFYNDSISGGALTEGRLKWYEQQFSKDPTGMLAGFLGAPDKLQEMVNSNNARKNILLNSIGIKNANQTTAPTPNTTPDGATGTFQGKPVIRQNGKWVPR